MAKDFKIFFDNEQDRLAGKKLLESIKTLDGHGVFLATENQDRLHVTLIPQCRRSKASDHL